ncbi:hypothetical protein C8A05DRAFT_33758 [Staphylotrichum tortipilum]|uniref:Uncharacterized protein n=1 Tax=Staphylotrichum tortipilum TaxID=2831512 RepID=A0AAN6MLB5_9PEZI|nr:hypothetical protein C8A05DRAFT_33758 [Staphylotrichum longicolle]
MFEVDWADYDCERVGERRARKENEKKEKKKRDDTSSNHESISTRTSRSSDHQHRSFFGTLGRKKQISSPSSSRKGRQQSGTAKLRKPDEKLKRTLSSNLGSTTSSLPPPPDEHLREPSISEAPREPSISEALREPSISEAPPIPPRHPAHAHDAGSSAAAKSMLSKMTQLTIPNPEPQGDGPTAEAAGTTTSLIRALNDEEPEVPPQPASEPPQADGDSVSADTCPEPEVKTASSPRTPRTPTSPRPTHIMAFPDNGRPASDIIDDWFTALHGPNRQLPRRGPNGTIRRGHVLLPPTLSRPLPTTPTRHSAASDSFSPPRPSSIRFLVDNPNHWKTPGEWGDSGSCLQVEEQQPE